MSHFCQKKGNYFLGKFFLGIFFHIKKKSYIFFLKVLAEKFRMSDPFYDEEIEKHRAKKQLDEKNLVRPPFVPFPIK